MNRAVSGTAGASLWDEQNLPAAKQIENSNNLSSFTIPPAAYRPALHHPVATWLSAVRKQGRPAEKAKAELPETSLGVYLGPQPFTKRWFLHRNRATWRCSLQETYTVRTFKHVLKSSLLHLTSSKKV